MTKMIAREAMLRYHRRLMREEAAWASTLAKGPKTLSRKPAALSAATGQRRGSEGLSDPTPERQAKAAQVSKSTTPPFNSQILGIAQKFARGLGAETMIVLERLYEIGVLADSSRGLVQSYEGPRVDGSSATYEHLSAVGRDAHEQFDAIMTRMPPELRRLTRELILEDTGRSRSAAEIGKTLTGYETEQRAVGAVIGVLKVIGWHAADRLGYPKRRRKSP